MFNELGRVSLYKKEASATTLHKETTQLQGDQTTIEVTSKIEKKEKWFSVMKMTLP